MLALTRTLFSALAAFALLFAATTQASSTGEQKQIFGEYEVHYMGLTTSFLSEDVAAAVGIKRSRSLGYLSISILHQAKGAPMAIPVTGKVTGTIRNLVGQTRELEFKEIKEQDGIYYITTFNFDDEDMYSFNLKAQPTNHQRAYDVKFSQRFYQE